MLWDVTSLDADNLARSLLNVWLPGEPIELHGEFKKNIHNVTRVGKNVSFEFIKKVH